MRRRHASSGFTLLELMLVMVLVTIVVSKIVLVVNTAMETSGVKTTELIVEDQAHKVLRQIAFSVMGSDRDSLNPAQSAPFTSDDVRYRINLGLQDGEVVWSDQEMIGLDDIDYNVFWSKNPDTEEKVRVVWTNLVAPYLEGEIPNGKDDNGNGLIDEKGLSFVVDRNAVTIYLTLDRKTKDGSVITKTVQTTVTCRNLEDPPE